MADTWCLFNLDEQEHPVRVSPTQFTNYWKELYDETKYPTAVYEQNLNITGQLDHHHVRALLCWRLAYLPSTERLEAVSNLTTWVWCNLKSFNNFRSLQDVSTEQLYEFWTLCQRIAKKAHQGFGTAIFLLHIARPMDYPPLDPHVLKAYHFIETGEITNPEHTLETYLAYRQFFLRLYMESNRTPREVEKALHCFGKHLKVNPLLFYLTG